MSDAIRHFGGKPFVVLGARTLKERRILGIFGGAAGKTAIVRGLTRSRLARGG